MVEPSFRVGERLLLVGRLSPRAALTVIDAVARHDRWAIVVCLREPPTPLLAVRRPMTNARRRPTGLVVRADPREPAVAAVDVLLQLHVAVLRRRSSATWRAIDAVRQHPTRTAAARSLGCSVQAVSQHVRGGNLAATAATLGLLTTLLAAQPSAGEAARRA